MQQIPAILQKAHCSMVTFLAICFIHSSSG
jgi:hypothetical protein